MHHLRTLISVAVAAALTQGFAAAQQASANGSPNTARAAAATNQGDPSVAQQATITAPVAVGETLIVKGTVEAIDKDKRRVTLKGDDGRTIRMYVGQGIPNFDKIKSGDRVTARFTEAVALSLAEETGSDIRSRVEAEAGRVAEKGKPGVQDLERSTIVANVMDVDRNAGSVTLRGVSGEPIRLKVQDKQALKDIDAGDQIVATFVESAAVSIEAGATSAGGQPSSGADSGAQARASASGAAATSGSAQSMQSGSAASGASRPAVATSSADYSKPMQELLQAAQSLREAAHAMAAQPAAQGRNEAIKQVNEALLETQRAMLRLPSELRSESTATAGGGADYGKSVERLQQAADELRRSIQAMATQPVGPQRSRAIDAAHEALLATNQAMLDAALIGEVRR